MIQLLNELQIVILCGWTYGPGFGSGGSQAAVSYIMTLEGSSVVIKFFKVHHFLHLERRRIMQRCF